MACRRCRVSGRVQGVWFRATTQRRAIELGVSGHARNLADGSVEVLACGELAAVEALCDWLWEGSAGARVASVTCDAVTEGVPAGFTTG